MSSKPSIDLYSQVGMQKVASLYKNNLEIAAGGEFSKINNGEIIDVQQIVEAAIDDRAKQQVLHILDKISLLKPPERLLLYLRMPSSSPESDPLRQSRNPLGTRSEINHTINWVRSHLEHDPNVSIPKQDVYDDYVVYCGRVDIKPLSTADFGKVMKQIFPEIRPRRLGTRGNSRYCYAALRKATKLPSPQLPEITKTVQSKDSSSDIDEESCEIIRRWAANLLNVEFEKTKDLADYITANNLKSPDSNSFRILQKKTTQKEGRNNRKQNEISASKKRKKKKRKGSIIAENPPLQTTDSQDYTKAQDIDHFLDIKQEFEVNQSLPAKISEKTQVNSRLPCTKITDDKIYTATLPNASSPNNIKTVLKTELPETENELQPNIYCKKLKQARQTKMLMGFDLHRSEMETQNSISAEANAALMKPPSYKHTLSRLQLEPNETCALKRVPNINTPSRTKKCKYTRPANQIVQKVDGEKEDVTTDIIIPRERVISICNLDKDALDDYLNEEDNSQEQEAELLKYFQPDEEHANKYEYTMRGKTHNSFPLVDNCQAPVGIKSEKKSFGDKGCDQISELRYYLQRNLHNIKEGNTTVGNVEHNPTDISSGYASATLTMLSNNHTKELEHQKPIGNDTSICEPLRKLNSKSLSHIPQSPNTRRKNFSFVPISPGPQSPHTNFNFHNNPTDKNPFISPRATSAARKFHQKHYNAVSLINGQSMVTSDETAFSKLIHSKEEMSASAPSSPSVILQNSKLLDNNCNFQINNNVMFHGYLECRSQSVPLHRQSPVCNNILNYGAYSSASNSVTQTPVPHEYNDFSDDHFLNILAQSSIAPNIKIEASDIGFIQSDLTVNNIDINMTAIYPEMNIRNNFNSSSRSVPSTPQPIHRSRACRIVNSLDISKSVPTTPIAMMGHSFPYSPEQNRDFLINGNTVDPENLTSFYCQQSNVNPVKDLPITDEIEDLSSFGDVADPIIGSDLLSNL